MHHSRRVLYYQLFFILILWNKFSFGFLRSKVRPFCMLWSYTKKDSNLHDFFAMDALWIKRWYYLIFYGLVSYDSIPHEFEHLFWPLFDTRSRGIETFFICFIQKTFVQFWLTNLPDLCIFPIPASFNPAIHVNL